MPLKIKETKLNHDIWAKVLDCGFEVNKFQL